MVQEIFLKSWDNYSLLAPDWVPKKKMVVEKGHYNLGFKV